MNVWLFVAGAVLVVWVFFDALWTTLWPEGGAGPMTDRVGGASWGIAKRVAGLGGKMAHGRLSAAGPVIIIITVWSWLLLLLAGLVLLFASHPQAVVDATTEVPATIVERIWFVLYTVSTMGNGEFMPNTAFFQILTGAASLSAISLLTLTFTFIIQVLAAVVDKRAFAGGVYSLGGTVTEVSRALQEARVEGLSNQLALLNERLGVMIERHKAYPVLHYFHPRDRSRSSSCAVAMLDEGLRVYLEGLEPDEVQLHAAALEPMRRTISNFLSSLEDVYLTRTEQAPPAPDRDRLREEGLELSRGDHLAEHTEEREERRQLLEGLVNYNGWRWDDIAHGT
jgi:hypothetical protein